MGRINRLWLENWTLFSGYERDQEMDTTITVAIAVTTILIVMALVAIFGNLFDGFTMKKK